MIKNTKSNNFLFNFTKFYKISDATALYSDYNSELEMYLFGCDILMNHNFIQTHHAHTHV